MKKRERSIFFKNKTFWISCSKYIYRAVYSRQGAPASGILRRIAFLMLDFSFRSIKLHLTNKCNLKCRHCYNQAGEEVLESRHIFSLLDQLKRGIRNRSLRLDILGGEPLLRKDLLEIVSYARKKIKIRTIQVFTNATLIDDEMAGKMKEAGVDIAVVPLHSHRPEIHDGITQCRGSWSKTVSGISSLVNSGISTYVFIIFMSSNSDKIKEVEAFARGLGAKTIFFPYIKQHSCDDLHIHDKMKYRELLKYAWENSDKHRSQMLSMIELRGKACPAFVNSITIKSDGTVTPCPFVDLNLGNIKRNKLYSILHNGYKNEELINFLSVPDECRRCSCLELCGGGCKAYRFQTYHDGDSKDINCAGPYKEKIALGKLGEYLPYFF